jgi:hypothetical protein
MGMAGGAGEEILGMRVTCICFIEHAIINTRLARIFNFISCCFLSPRPFLMPPQRRPPPSESAASKLIRDIRSAHGFDNNRPAEAQDPAVRELRGKLERALER